MNSISQKSFYIGLILLATLTGYHLREGLPWEVKAAAQSNTAATPTTGVSRAESRRTEIVDAAKIFAPSVVSVGASRSNLMISPHAHFFREFTIFEKEEKTPYLGSGVIVDPDGLIVTNWHVIEGAKDVFVTLNDGRELPGTILDADTALDVALIKVEATDLPAAKLGNSNDLMVGEWVLAMGNPFGNVISNPEPTVTVGVVSALRRNFKPNREMASKVYLNMIQTDAAINPGNSGGALINAAGELVGINSFIVSRSGGAVGIGFAIPVNRVMSVVKEIVDNGRVRSRLIDFQTQDLTERHQRMLGTKAKIGALVSEIADGGPARQSGIEVGDVIVKVNGQPVTDSEQATLAIWSNQVGAKFDLEIDRGGKIIQTQYTLVEPPKERERN